MEDERVVEKPVPGEKLAPPPEEYTAKEAVEPGGPGEGRPTPSPKPTPPPEPAKEDKK